jgi:hypothetical protein
MIYISIQHIILGVSVKTCSTVLVKAPHDHNIFNFVLELDPIMFKKTILKIKHWRVEKKSTAKLGKGYQYKCTIGTKLFRVELGTTKIRMIYCCIKKIRVIRHVSLRHRYPLPSLAVDTETDHVS